MRASSFLLASALFASALPLHAERYGSETALTLQGTYYRPGETTTLRGVDHASYTTHRVTNATILARMDHDDLIDGVKGYSLVMVSRAHAADGVKFFATHRTKTPVEVPSSLLALHVNDGPMKGTALFSVDGDLKDLARQTLNSAEILQGDFFGLAILSQKWTEKAVKTNGVTEVVELVNGSGTFEGLVDDEDEPGVGTLVFKLSGAKPVDLTRYGMAATGESISITGGVLKVGSGVSLLNNSEAPVIGRGALVLSGNSTYTGQTYISSFVQGVADGVLTTGPIFLGGASLAPGELLLNPSSTGDFVFSGGLTDYSGFELFDFTLPETIAFSDTISGNYDLIYLDPALNLNTASGSFFMLDSGVFQLVPTEPISTPAP